MLNNTYYKLCKKYKYDISGRIFLRKKRHLHLINCWINRMFRQRIFFQRRVLQQVEKKKNKKFVAYNTNKNMKQKYPKINKIPFKYRTVRRGTARTRIIRRKRKTLYGITFVMKQRIKAFYNGLTNKKFFKIMSKNSFINLELQLSTILFRSNFTESIGSAIQYIQHHGIYVNKKKYFNDKYITKIGDIIQIPIELHTNWILKKTLYGGKSFIFTNIPNFLIVNFRIGTIYIIKNPTYTSTFYPFRVNYSLFKY